MSQQQPITTSYPNPLYWNILLADVDTGGGLASVQNQTGSDLIVTAFANVGTVATGACAMDVGVTSTSSTTSSDTLMDGIDIHSATGTFSYSSGDATNALQYQRWPAGKWVTASKASGASAGAVASLYLVAVPVAQGG